MKAETDTKWEKLSSKKKRVTKSKISSPNVIHSDDESKFPHSTFLFRLEHKDRDGNRICWFQSESELIKHISRYNLTDYKATYH